MSLHICHVFLFLCFELGADTSAMSIYTLSIMTVVPNKEQGWKLRLSVLIF